MIDFIKALITGINVLEFQQHPELNFCIPVNPITGEVKTKTNKKASSYLQAFYKGLEFRIYESGSLYISGSLHKYWNNGGHNFNDFNLLAVYEVLKDIHETFNIKPHQILLKSLEIGVNFIPPKPTNKILQYCFLHRTSPFVWIRNNDEGKYIQSDHSQYIIKIYDKARHYRSKGFEVPHPEIMRFEIKFKKLERIKNLGIYTIQDLIEFGMKNFTSILIEEWRKVFFYDYSIKSECKALFNYKNPIYWQELTERSSKSAFNKHRGKLRELIKNHSENIPQQLEKFILDKCNYLTDEGAQIDQNTTFNNCRSYTIKKGNEGKQIDQNQTDKKRLKNNQVISTAIIGSNTVKGTQIDTLYIKSNHTPLSTKNKYCKITGVNISMQKDCSEMLSHTGLKYYFNTDRKIFKELINKYCPDEWKQSDHKTQIEKTAHAIRCKKTNIENKQKRLYPENQYRLFDIRIS